MRHATILLLLATVGCGDGAPTFVAERFPGTWSGRWRDEGGRRGGLTLQVELIDGRLQFACDLLGPTLPGLTPPTERFSAAVGAHRATIEGHASQTFGTLSGTLAADGALVIDCADVRGPIDDLHAEGTWSADAIALEVDVSYDDRRRKSLATVELTRR